MLLSRRDTIGLVGASTAVTLLPLPALAQDITADSTPPRMPLDEFVRDATLLDALRRGVRKMKARKPSDPLSWFFQAAIHGVTLDLIQKAAQIDSNLINVDQKKHWNQCPHFGQGSANFLPWHRGYTYYFERILRAHTGEPRFSLPYWDYHRPENYRFPKEFGLRTLDQPLDGDSTNPLYHAERNIYFTDWQHWSDPDYKPYSQLTPEAVDWTPARDAPIFFGITERDGLGGTISDEDPSTRGRLESFPHDPIHRLVGGVIPQPDGSAATGGMANPPTAGFDPIFCVHHSNMDRLWAEWSRMPGKSWGKLPPESWLNGKPWTFFDVKWVNGELAAIEVNRPRRDYFDYRALGISFRGEDMSATPLPLPSSGSIMFGVPTPAPSRSKLVSRVEALSVVSGSIPARVSIDTAPQALRSTFLSTKSLTQKLLQQNRVLMRITGVNLGAANSMGYDVHLVRTADTKPRRTDPSFVGMIALFRSDDPSSGGHQAHTGEAGGVTRKPSDTFDVTDALRAVGETDPRKMSVVIVPFSLSSSEKGEIVDTVGVQFDGLEFYSKG